MPTEIQIPIFGDGNIIESDYHTLITKDIPGEEIPLKDQNGNVLEGFFERKPAFNIHKLYLTEFLDETKHGFHKIVNRLQEADSVDALELHIAGHGGSVAEGIALYNLVNSKYSKRSTAFLDFGYSMNALAFLFCNERVVYEHSSLMFHAYSGGYFGKRDEILAQIEHTDEHLQKFSSQLLAPYFTKKEIKKMSQSKDFWLNSIEMLERGIATAVIINGEYFTRNEYYEKYNKKGKVRRKWVKEQAELLKIQQEEEAAFLKSLEG